METAFAEGDGGDAPDPGPRQHAPARTAAPEPVPFDGPGDDPARVVARIDEHTRVEVAVRHEGVDVRLETTASELPRYAGLEDDLRSALQQGDSDLASFHARDDGSDGSRRDDGDGGDRPGTPARRGSSVATPAAPTAQRGRLLNTVA
ncbi:MAG: hypothetical protein KC656_18330 [Myxococcales bacterium]|nr:hypothetical protein [Myxococcales bacterium]